MLHKRYRPERVAGKEHHSATKPCRRAETITIVRPSVVRKNGAHRPSRPCGHKLQTKANLLESADRCGLEVAGESIPVVDSGLACRSSVARPALQTLLFRFHYKRVGSHQMGTRGSLPLPTPSGDTSRGQPEPDVTCWSQDSADPFAPAESTVFTRFSHARIPTLFPTTCSLPSPHTFLDFSTPIQPYSTLFMICPRHPSTCMRMAHCPIG